MIKPLSTPSGGVSLAAQPNALPKAATQFEAVFLRQMIGSMRQAKLADDDLFGSSAEDTFQDMSDAHLADNMAGKGFGIAEMLTKQLGKVNTAVSSPSGSPPAGNEGR